MALKLHVFFKHFYSSNSKGKSDQVPIFIDDKENAHALIRAQVHS